LHRTWITRWHHLAWATSFCRSSGAVAIWYLWRAPLPAGTRTTPEGEGSDDDPAPVRPASRDRHRQRPPAQRRLVYRPVGLAPGQGRLRRRRPRGLPPVLRRRGGPAGHAADLLLLAGRHPRAAGHRADRRHGPGCAPGYASRLAPSPHRPRPAGRGAGPARCRAGPLRASEVEHPPPESQPLFPIWLDPAPRWGR